MGPDDPIFANQRTAMAAGPQYPLQAYSTINLAQDVGFPDFMRGGSNFAGATVNRDTVMRNTAVKRSINLISNVMGFLPLPLLQNTDGGKDLKAKSHPLYSILGAISNSQQDAYQFRKLLQRWALIDGNAYAEIVRSRGQITSLLPIHPSKVKARKNWDDPYIVQGGRAASRTIQTQDMFHLFGDSDDGLNGISLVDEAADALGVTLQADRAAANLFKNGALIRDVLSTDNKLSAEAITNLRASINDGHAGAGNANKTIVLEQGLKYGSVTSNARDSQHLETRKHQIEEIGRIFGMPRPFLMMDDTSWGSGIEQLGIFLVTFTLNPWMKAWESAISRQLLTPPERRAGFKAKFNEKALLRGSMKDQAEFLAKMMGSGGSPQILEQNEAREVLEFPAHPDGSGLSNGAMGVADGTTGQDQA